MVVLNANIPVAPAFVSEDPLAYLPNKPVMEYGKGQVIYAPDEPARSLYLVRSGMVKILVVGNHGDSFVANFHRADEFFGETALLGRRREEAALAMENVSVMSWSTDEIQRIATKEPRLGLALAQMLAQKNIELRTRIESFALKNVESRLAITLLNFSKRFGHDKDGGGTGMRAFTHETLSVYVGTSREIVTHYMTLFRQRRLIDYSRQSITVYRELLEKWLRLHS